MNKKLLRLQWLLRFESPSDSGPHDTRRTIHGWFHTGPCCEVCRWLYEVGEQEPFDLPTDECSGDVLLPGALLVKVTHE